MSTQVILLERIEKLGAMGDVVSVKPGYARNYLIPQNKALRATDSNIAYFETQKAALEKLNAEKKKAAEDKAKGFKGMTVTLIRQAGETGQLYGSVAARDIADTINEDAKEKVERNMVEVNQNFKEIGLFPVALALHPEVKVEITVNIARSEDEAAIQLKTGKALVADDSDSEAQAEASDEAAEKAKEELMESDALEAEKVAEAEAAEKAAEEEAKSAAKAEARAAKKAAAEVEEAEEAEEAETAEASAEEASDEASEEEKKDA